MRKHRRKPQRAHKRTVLVATNGRVTEHAYLSRIKQLHGLQNTTVKVEVINASPRNFLKKLSSPQGDTSGYDQVWIVLDEDGEDLSQFIQDCKRLNTPRQDWFAIISRPSFEVWLIAHYEQVRKYSNQSEAQKHFARLIPPNTPKKGLPSDFPYEAMQLALDRCHLKGEEPASINSLPPLPGTAMTHLIHGLAIKLP